MSKKNIYLLVISIVTVFCIIAGSVINLGNFNFFGVNSYEEGDFSDSGILENFDSIKINGKVLEINITDGDIPSFKITSNREKLLPNVKINGSELIISQENIGMNKSRASCKVFITVPNYQELKKIEIETNVGEIDISDISSDFISVTTNVGELNFEDINFNELNGQSNVGEISVDELPCSLDDFNISLSTNVGEVRVDNIKFKRSYNQKGNTSKKIGLSTNVGEIIIE